MKVLYVRRQRAGRRPGPAGRLARLAPDVGARHTAYTLADRPLGSWPCARTAGTLPDVLLVDVRLPDGNGLELLGEVRGRGPSPSPGGDAHRLGRRGPLVVAALPRRRRRLTWSSPARTSSGCPPTLAAAVASFRQSSAQRPAPIRVLYRPRPVPTTVDLLAAPSLSRATAPHVPGGGGVQRPGGARRAASAPTPTKAPNVLLLEFQGCPA